MTAPPLGDGNLAPLDGLLAGITERHPLHTQFLDRAIAFLTPQERDRLEGILRFLLSQGHTLAYVVDCYLTVVEDTTGEQMHFFRHGEYRHKSYAEVADRVYHDRSYMDRYMYGLVLTAFLWPNHVQIARFFEKVLPTDRSGNYLEVGPGHGFFMASAAARGSFDRLTGIDISAASISQTRALLDHFAPGVSERCELRLADFHEAADLQSGSFDALIMGEVLEHVENPDVFLRRLHGLARDDAFIYVTTCVNAPAIDHIFLWRTTDEIEALIEASGFQIVEALRLPYEGKTLEQARKQALPINVAYVLAKAGG